MELKVNDRVVHASFGVGRIKSVAIKEIGKKKRSYFKVKTDKLTYWIPVKNNDSARVRPLCTASTFNAMLSKIRRKPEKLSNNYRSRTKFIKEEIDKCSLLAKSSLIRDLHYRNSEKPLHVNEHRIYEKLKTQFAKEYSIAADIDEEKANSKLEEALMVSLQKVQPA